jgi:hypothetical protein
MDFSSDQSLFELCATRRGIRIAANGHILHPKGDAPLLEPAAWNREPGLKYLAARLLFVIIHYTSGMELASII